MATIISQLRKRNLKAKRGYPWGKWTDGKVRRAINGKDFTCTLPGFRATLYSYAERHGFSVEVSSAKKSVDFRFIPRAQA